MEKDNSREDNPFLLCIPLDSATKNDAKPVGESTNMKQTNWLWWKRTFYDMKHIFKWASYSTKYNVE